MGEGSEEQIRRDLVRTVIKQPLYDMIAAARVNDAAARVNGAAAPRVIPVIIEANDDYYTGKTAAVTELTGLIKLTADADVLPIGSERNVYYKVSLPASRIAEVAEKDCRHAMEIQPPGEPLVRYLSIRRIWYDHPVNGLIDKSVSTVKVDAARRLFLADGKDIVWAVIDSGIDGAHGHFGTNKNLEVKLPLEHCDFSAAGGSSATALTDGLGHGTHVAGTIAGQFSGMNGIANRTRADEFGEIETFHESVSLIAGMAPACKLVSMKVLDDQGQGGISNIIAAIDKIQNINDFGRNMRIHGVNLSVGYEFDPVWFACGQSPVCVEVNRLVRSGVVVVVAAGNTGYGSLSSNQRPTGAGMMMTINDPGNAELAITVGSTHRESPHTYGVSYFSSKGPTGDGRIKPDLVAPGERILSCCAGPLAGGAVNVYVEDSGTSMAAPHVSGAIAAFLSIHREYIGNPEKVKELFLASATDLGREPYFQGRGLLDLMRAIQSV